MVRALLVLSRDVYVFSNSIRACSGPAIIHILKADGFAESPTAPPEPLTNLLFCSRVWSIGIVENRFVVFGITQWQCSSNSL